MRTVRFVHPTTGAILDGLFTGSDEAIEANTPADHQAVDVAPDTPLRTVADLGPAHVATARLVQIGRILNASRWTQEPDSGLTGPDRAAWAKYRSDLRPLPHDADLPEAPPRAGSSV